MKTTMGKTLTYLILSALIVFGSININVHAGEYDDWIMPPDPVGTVYGTGYIPPDVEYPMQPLRILPRASYPSRYPAGITHTDIGYTLYTINQFQSQVKNQGQTELCWSFASMGAIEASTIKAGVGMPGISPLNAGHALSTASGNSIYGFAGRPLPDSAGNADMIMNYAMRDAFNGFVKWDDDTTNFGAGIPPRPIAQTSAERRSYIVPGAYRINTGKASKDEIKAAVTQYGAVTTTMFGNIMSSDSPNTNQAAYYFNKDTAAYYLPPASGIGSDHLVLIVGWDDDYPRANFAAYKPTNNGAWLVKNSWGTGWGKSGYFWMSYEDKYAGDNSWVFSPARTIETADYLNRIYDYNSSNYAITWGGGQTLYGTNIFTAGSSNETLTQVRVYINSAPQNNIPVYLTNN
jgi:C1A family cysteine protease